MIPGTIDIRLYIGLRHGELWPPVLDEPSIFLIEREGNSDGAETSLVFYSDQEQKVHVSKDPELNVDEDGGFMASYPSVLRSDAAWGVLTGRNEQPEIDVGGSGNSQ